MIADVASNRPQIIAATSRQTVDKIDQITAAFAGTICNPTTGTDMPRYQTKTVVKDRLHTICVNHPAFAPYMQREKARDPVYFAAQLAGRSFLKLRSSQIKELLDMPRRAELARQCAGKDD